MSNSIKENIIVFMKKEIINSKLNFYNLSNMVMSSGLAVNVVNVEGSRPRGRGVESG